MIRLLRRFFRLSNHEHVQHVLATHETTLLNNERRLEHLRRERLLYQNRKGGTSG